MAETHNVGRWVGGAMLVTFVVDLLSNFKLQGELFAGGGFIVNAATHPLTIGSIVVLGMLSSLLIKGFAPGTDRVADVAHGA